MHEPRKPEDVSCYFTERANAGPDPVIDDRTWADLDMDEVFQAVDRTRSSVGQAVLYDMLRRPLFDAEAFRERAAAIQALGEDARGRFAAFRVLEKLGVQPKGEVYRFLTSTAARIDNRRRYRYLTLSVLAVLVIPAAILLGLQGLFLFLAMMIVNMVIHYKFKPRVAAEAPSFDFLHRLLAAAEKLGRLELAPLAGQTAELRALSESLRKLTRRTRFLSTPSGMSGDIIAMFAEYIRQYFLQEVTTYYFVYNEIVRRMPDLARLYGLVGGVDALCAVAQMRKETRTVTPELADGALFDAEEAVHPLLEEPVANSVRLAGRGIVVTGSNMSGKSTFLRTIGVNQVLATTICAAYARRLRTSMLLTVTSITNRDNIMASESHYMVEAKRLLDILTASRGEHPALVIIDEILSGTNSEERIAASIRILGHLAGLNCRVVAATHDRAIAAALDGVYGNLHFTHLVEREGLEFDYKLREGIVEAGNAIRLLRLLGYPAEIMEDL
jgi:DNA mismatch repair ATPase MutS